MNRRSFLQLIPAALVGATLDPERLLWVPGAKTIFLPTPEFTDTFALKEWHGIADVSWQLLLEKRPFAFEIAVDSLNAAFRKRMIDLLNADILHVPIPRRN